jgi:hypothetical protein
VVRTYVHRQTVRETQQAGCSEVNTPPRVRRQTVGALHGATPIHPGFSTAFVQVKVQGAQVASMDHDGIITFLVNLSAAG